MLELLVEPVHKPPEALTLHPTADVTQGGEASSQTA